MIICFLYYLEKGFSFMLYKQYPICIDRIFWKPQVSFITILFRESRESEMHATSFMVISIVCPHGGGFIGFGKTQEAVFLAQIIAIERGSPVFWNCWRGWHKFEWIIAFFWVKEFKTPFFQCFKHVLIGHEDVGINEFFILFSHGNIWKDMWERKSMIFGSCGGW